MKVTAALSAIFITLLMLLAIPAEAIRFNSESAVKTERKAVVIIDIQQHSWRSFSFNPKIRGIDPAQYTFNWDFGDGNSSNISNPLHIYRRPGSYFVTMVATDLLGRTIEKRIPLNVSFYNLGNSKLWILIVGIIAAGTAMARFVYFLASRKVRAFEQRNKQSEHPVLIRKTRLRPYRSAAGKEKTPLI